MGRESQVGLSAGSDRVDQRRTCLLRRGAGFGSYSSLAARLGAQVFASEPDEENAKSLRRHQAELNALTPRIKIVKLTVLGTSGVTHFEPALQERGIGNGKVSEGREQAITVHCTSLDDFVGLNSLPNLIKIDVEGSKELFDRCRPSVICEVHDAANALFVSDWLERKGYSWSTSGIAVSIPLTWSLRRNEDAGLKGGPGRTLADSGTGWERPFELRGLFGRQRFQSD